MVTSEHTVQHYLGDLIAVVHHVSEAVERHTKDEKLARIGGAGPAIRKVDRVLKQHLAALELHAKSAGTNAEPGFLKDAVTTVTGIVAGLYGSMRSETASRMLRDDYTALNFVMVCTAMLHTTAVASADPVTAELTQRHLNELPALIMAVSEWLPHAVVADVAADGMRIVESDAAGIAVRHVTQAWEQASEANPTQ